MKINNHKAYIIDINLENGFIYLFLLPILQYLKGGSWNDVL